MNNVSRGYCSLILVALILGFVGSVSFAKNVNAQNQPYATVHVPSIVPPGPDQRAGYWQPKKNWVDGVDYSRNAMIAKAQKLGPDELAKLNKSFEDQTVRILGDAPGPGLNNQDPGYLEYPPGSIYEIKKGPNKGKKAYGADKIEEGLKEIAAAKNDKPADPNAKPNQDVCVYLGGGPVNEKLDTSTASGIEVKNKSTGYGKYVIPAYAPEINSEQNNNIIQEQLYNYGRVEPLQDRFNKVVAEAKTNMAILENKGMKVTIVTPTVVESLNISKEGGGTYENGMLPGKYRVGQPSKAGEQGIPAGKTMSPACEPVDGKIPELPGSEGNPFPGLGGPGGGGAPGSSMLGGLGQMLPLLLAGMLGGGQGQQGQGQNGQNQYGAGYGNQQQDQCLYQPADPVCGDDGKSYRNAYCANQYRARIRNNGVCIAVTPTPIANTIAITSLSPLKGAVGSTIVITGSGFSAMGNSVHFGEGGSKNISSIADGRVILFDVPQDISGCDFWPSSGISCTQPARTVTPDTYSVMVTNASGQNSNEKSFTVTTGKADVFPTAVRDSIKNIISTIFANIFGGAHVGETVIR